MNDFDYAYNNGNGDAVNEEYEEDMPDTGSMEYHSDSDSGSAQGGSVEYHSTQTVMVQ